MTNKKLEEILKRNCPFGPKKSMYNYKAVEAIAKDAFAAGLSSGRQEVFDWLKEQEGSFVSLRSINALKQRFKVK